jgi:cyclopropane fatty-acyl-phospholipid synthase-like methyltransferase
MIMHVPEKPYAPACDRNRVPILAVLREYFADRQQVLEIGSGTGQHAVYFAAALPHLVWQTSDRPENLAGIRLWLEEAALPNTPPPIALDVNGPWPRQRFDAAFSANTLHILAWAEVERLFAGLATVLEVGAKLVIYGPFNYGGRYTSESNARFDQWLKAEDPMRGIRDFEAVEALAADIGLTLLEDRAMPANNRCLIWLRAGRTQTHAG